MKVLDDTGLARLVQKIEEKFVQKTDGVTDIGNSVIDLVYPVGSVYTTMDAADPATRWAGTTWERFGQGKMLLSANTVYPAGSTGGEATHTLTTAEMPVHRHSLRIQNTVGGSMGNSSDAGITAGTKNSINTDTDSHYTNQPRAISDSGGGQPHNNMPPYISVYMWKRTA